VTRLGRLVLYTARLEEVAAFYTRHFGYRRHDDPADRITELRHPTGPALLLHPAAKGQRAGHSAVKLVFDTPDVAAFCAEAADRGLDFGPVHAAQGYSFANAKDPAGNSVQVSSRAFRDA